MIDLRRPVSACCHCGGKIVGYRFCPRCRCVWVLRRGDLMLRPELPAEEDITFFWRCPSGHWAAPGQMYPHPCEQCGADFKPASREAWEMREPGPVQPQPSALYAIPQRPWWTRHA